MNTSATASTSVDRLYYESTAPVFVKYDGTPIDSTGATLVLHDGKYYLSTDTSYATEKTVAGYIDASYKVVTGKTASGYDKKAVAETKAVADKNGNSYYAQSAYISLGDGKSTGSSDKTYAVALSDSGKDTSNGTVYTVSGWNGTETIDFKSEDSFGTLKAGDVFEYSKVGDNLYDIDKVSAAEYYVNAYDDGTGEIQLYNVVSNLPGTAQTDTTTINKTTVDSKKTVVIYVDSKAGKGADANDIQAAYIFDENNWNAGKLPAISNMQIVNGKVVDKTSKKTTDGKDSYTNYLTEDNAPNVKAYFDDDDQITLLVVDINNNITKW